MIVRANSHPVLVAMRTLIVSDLHLGSGSGADVLRRPELRAALLEAFEDVDRLVLLGDVLELRHGPPRDAMAAARPFFEDLGRALAGRELVVIAGNHDHALVEPWLDARALAGEPEPLGLEQRLLEPAEASPMLARIAEWAAPARVDVAYPGLWVRPDVYATHGHYLDCHLTVPTLERLSVGAMSRVLGRPAAAFSRVEDYEAVSPVFAWRDAVAREARTGRRLERRGHGARLASARRRGGGGVRHQPVASCAGSRSRAPSRSRWPRSTAPGSGPCGLTSPPRSCAAPGCGRWARWRRGSAWATPTWSSATPTAPGPLPGDHEAEWRGRGGARLVNAGCWTYDSVFLTSTPGESPYWPGRAWSSRTPARRC